MFIPLRHENMHGRRWPVVTLSLIALNVLAFLGTHWSIEQQGHESIQVRAHILILAATHPGLTMPPDVGKFVTTIQAQSPVLWRALQRPDRPPEDSWDARMQMEQDPVRWQAEMDSLSTRFAELEQTTILRRYAFVPGHVSLVSYLTANFLHGGWLHLIGNMWFLWLAGSILEDTWGRPIFTVLYLFSGAMALQFHAWCYPGSAVPTLGASGAVAALMGAFLVRFPTVKIQIAMLLGVFRIYRFWAAAYWLLPIWLLMEIFSGGLFGQYSGVAHWAHVGGFLFGCFASLVIRGSGLERMAEQAIQGKIAWVSHPLLAQVNEQLEKGELDAAVDSLTKYVQEKPDSVEGLRMLGQVQLRKDDRSGRQATLLKLLNLQIAAKGMDEAELSLQELRNAGGGKLPAPLWLAFARLLEDHQKNRRAVEEYAAIAEAYPVEKQALLANLAAGRLCLKQLKRASEALLFFRAAQSSPVPHLDWEANIERGIAEAKEAVEKTLHHSGPQN